MYRCAVKLIKKGKAYICNLNAEQIKQTRGSFEVTGTDSPNRNRPIDESLTIFEQMRDGKFKDGEYVLRAKIDMQSPNINLRDPVIYRIMHSHHHRQGNKWCIYPMYDFAHTIEDFLEGITHSICTLEFENHRPLYDWVAVECELNPPPHQYEFARLNLTRTIMSKRYLKKLVDEKAVEGWCDPRMPTIAGLRRRGYTPSSIKKFCADIGVSKANSTVDIAMLESCIRDELNESAERAMVVLNPLLVEIVNKGDDFFDQLDFEINPNCPTKATRKITISNKIYIDQNDFAINPPKGFKRLSEGGFVRLKSGYIIKYIGHEFDKSGQVCLIKAEIVQNSRSGSDTSGVKPSGVVHWVNAKDCVDISARLYDYLLDDNEGESFENRLNPNSLIVKNAKAEKYLSDSKAASYQFLREAYFVKDSKSKGLVFNRTVELKDSFKK